MLAHGWVITSHLFTYTDSKTNLANKNHLSDCLVQERREVRLSCTIPSFCQATLWFYRIIYTAPSQSLLRSIILQAMTNEGITSSNFIMYRQPSDISRTSTGNKTVDHSDVVGASPVGTAPSTSSFSTKHLVSMIELRQRQDKTRMI